MADAIKYIGDDDHKETVQFVRIFYRFFDMLNTRSLEESIYKRKPDLEPYRTPTDSRLNVSILIIIMQLWCDNQLQWLETDFMGYLEEWNQSVRNRRQIIKGKEEKFTAAQRNKMCLSGETLAGLKMTGIKALS